VFTFVPNIVPNNAASPAPVNAGFTGCAESGSGQFESILASILVGTAADSALPQAEQTGLQSALPDMRQTPSSTQIDALLEQLRLALETNAELSNAGQADLLRALQQALTPAGRASLEDALRACEAQAQGPKALELGADDGVLRGWALDSAVQLEGRLSQLDQIIAQISAAMQQSGTLSSEAMAVDAAGQTGAPQADLQNILLLLTQLRDALQAAAAGLMAKTEAATMPQEPDAAPANPLHDQSGQSAAAGRHLLGQPTGLPITNGAGSEQAKQLPCNLPDLQPRPQISAEAQGPQEEKPLAGLLQALQDRGLAAQNGFAKSDGQGGSLYSQTMMNKLALGAYQQASPARQAGSNFLNDLQLLKVFSGQAQAAGQESQLGPLPMAAEAAARLAGVVRVGRLAGAPDQVFAVDEGAQAVPGAKIDQAHKPLTSMQTSPTAVLHQVAERIAVGLQRGETRLSMQIHPPSLGKISIDLSGKNNELRAVIFAETAQAKLLLESNLDQLRASLESQNLDVAKVSVEVGTDDRQFASLLREHDRRPLPATGLRAEDVRQPAGTDDSAMAAAYAAYSGSRSMVDLFA